MTPKEVATELFYVAINMGTLVTTGGDQPKNLHPGHTFYL